MDRWDIVLVTSPLVPLISCLFKIESSLDTLAHETRERKQSRLLIEPFDPEEQVSLSLTRCQQANNNRINKR
jgi:hypothetical protein